MPSRSSGDPVPLTAHSTVLNPDPSRVIVKLFVPGEDGFSNPSRTARLVNQIAGLDEDEAGAMLEDTLRRFHSHTDLESVLRHHFELIRHRAPQSEELSQSRQLLIGAFFSNEYAVEAAALCNPCVVAHPDQSALQDGQLRVALSLRQIGEGHISSIGFASAVIGPGHRLDVDDRSGPLSVGRRTATRHRRDLLAGGLAEASWDNEVTATVLSVLPESFNDNEFEYALTHVPHDLMTRFSAPGTLEQLRRTLVGSYSVTFPPDVPLGRRVLWPSTPHERNGMEDARFTLFTDDSQAATYLATYTAYDGREISSRMLISTDLQTFDVNPLRGPAATNKGMAFFPRRIKGTRFALCRSDGVTLGLTTLDANSLWQAPFPLYRPSKAWELIQVGNCGSPIETPEGWLVLTHGVGPMRRYCMSAILLDLDHPERIIGRLPAPLLSPDDADRYGYVPNVIYSCGALVHKGILWLPYGIGDSRVRIASMPLDDLLAAMI